MRRLIVVYNPKSSRADFVEKEVFCKVRNMTGFLVGKYKVLQIGFENNVQRLAGILEDKDLVVAAGGDATASIALNGCMESGKKVTFAALALGNFCDMARGLGNLDIEAVVERFLGGEEKNFYPLDVRIDGKHFRYAGGYLTVGMFAESTKVFERKKVRRDLRGRNMRIYSYFLLFKWYLENRKKKFLPEFTDYIAMNGVVAGGIMRGDKWFLTREFLCGSFELRHIARMCGFMMRAIVKRIPGEMKGRDVLEFKEKTEVMLQIEGEGKRVLCREIEVRKNDFIRVIIK